MTGMRLATAYRLVSDDLHGRLSARRTEIQKQLDELEVEQRQLVFEITMNRSRLATMGMKRCGSPKRLWRYWRRSHDTN